METELKVVYNILETVRAGKTNADENLNERIIRSYIQEFRGDIIRKHFREGHTVSEMVFQKCIVQAPGNRLLSNNESIHADLSNNSLLVPSELDKEKEVKKYTFKIPKVIALSENYGMYFNINGVKVPIIDSYQYDIRSKDFFNKKQVMAVFRNVNHIDLYIPNSTIDTTDMIRKYSFSRLNENKFKFLDLELHAILDNPDDGYQYDWTKDPFPFPSERMTELVYSILARKFQIILNAKSDEVINSRGDQILYHENHNLSNQ